MHSFTKIYIALAAAAGVSASLEIYNKYAREQYILRSS